MRSGRTRGVDPLFALSQLLRKRPRLSTIATSWFRQSEIVENNQPPVQLILTKRGFDNRDVYGRNQLVDADNNCTAGISLFRHHIKIQPLDVNCCILMWRRNRLMPVRHLLSTATIDPVIVSFDNSGVFALTHAQRSDATHWYSPILGTFCRQVLGSSRRK